MSASAPGNRGLPIDAIYAATALDWCRLVRAYTQSVRLYRETMRRQAERQCRTTESDPPPTARPRVSLTLAVVREAVSDGHADVTLPARLPDERGDQSEERSGRRTRRGPLTDRQLEIAALIARGLTNGQIACELVLTPGTVGNHVAHILRRLGAKNRAEVAAWMTRRTAMLYPVEPASPELHDAS